jgi:hypothetical protein
MKHAVEMGSCAMIYIPSFITIGSAIRKFIRGDSQTHRLAEWWSHKMFSVLAYFLFSSEKKKTEAGLCDLYAVRVSMCIPY